VSRGRQCPGPDGKDSTSSWVDFVAKGRAGKPNVETGHEGKKVQLKEKPSLGKKVSHPQKVPSKKKRWGTPGRRVGVVTPSKTS